MTVPEPAVALVKRFEGLRLEPYRDAAGFWTVGYGHLVSRDRGTTRPAVIDAEQAEALLAADLGRTARQVGRLIRVPVEEGQYGALVSFAFNVGSAALAASTLLRKVNAEDHAAVPGQFLRWTMAGGRKLPGLVRRRTAEAAMYGYLR